jgi:hypothetical protein
MYPFNYNDGGRQAALLETCDADKYFGKVGDCVARAISILVNKPYAQVWADIAAINKKQRRHNTANKGVKCSSVGFKMYIDSLNLTYVNLRDKNGFRPMVKDIVIPQGRVMLDLVGHAVTFIDGVMNDTFDCSPAGRALICGYWIHKSAPQLFNVVSETGAILNRAPLNSLQATTMSNLMWLNYKRNTIIKPV